MAAQNNTIAQKKELAKLLYTAQGITEQKTLAERVGVSKQTINKWVNSEDWERLRQSLVLTKEAELRRLYMQVTELNDAIMQREVGKRFADSKEADVIAKLTASIRQLETDTSVAETIEVMKNFISFISPEDLDAAKLITKWADIFIKSIIK